MKLKLEKGFQSFSIQPIDMDFLDFIKEIEPVIKEFSLYRMNRDPKTKRTYYELEKAFFNIDFKENKIYLVNTYLTKFINIYGKRFDIKIIENKNYEVESLHNIFIKSEYKPRDYQKIYIDAIVKNKVPRILVDLYTGYGKSLIATIAAVRRGKRFGMLVLAGYIKKWIKDFKTYTNLKDEEIFVVQGSAAIRQLTNLSDEELKKYKVIIFSLTTVKKYVENYLSMNDEFKYDLTPKEFIRKLKIETIISDEAHQEFHNVYALTIMLDPKFMLALTATLISSTHREEQIQRYFLPKNYRLSDIIEYTKYIQLFPISYKTANPAFLKAENQFGYNHGKFEDKIKKRKQTLKNYLELISYMVDALYLKYRVKGDKCIIFAYTVEMCSIIRDYLKEKKIKLKINKYTAEDDYEIIEKSDIIVSTLGSAGTALDIPNLITVVQTVMVKSATANIQALGRLRKLKDKKVRFGYIYASNIKKHNEYHRERLGLYRDRVVAILNYNYTKLI